MLLGDKPYGDFFGTLCVVYGGGLAGYPPMPKFTYAPCDIGSIKKKRGINSLLLTPNI